MNRPLKRPARIEPPQRQGLSRIGELMPLIMARLGLDAETLTASESEPVAANYGAQARGAPTPRNSTECPAAAGTQRRQKDRPTPERRVPLLPSALPTQNTFAWYQQTIETTAP